MFGGKYWATTLVVVALIALIASALTLAGRYDPAEAQLPWARMIQYDEIYKGDHLYSVFRFDRQFTVVHSPDCSYCERTKEGR